MKTRHKGTDFKSDDLVLDTMVLGGPCICFAKGDPLRLTLQDLVDCLMPILEALRLGAPTVLFFQSHESDLMADVLDYDKNSADFLTMKTYLLRGIERALEILGEAEFPKLYVIDTRDTDTCHALDERVKDTKNFLPDDRLYGLYAKVNGATYPRGRPEEALMLTIYRRNMMLYTGQFLRNIGVPKAKRLLFVESTTQERAIRLAAELLDSSVDFRGYHAAANKQGKEMNLGNRNHKINLRLTPAQSRLRCDDLEKSDPEFTKAYTKIFGSIPLHEIMEAWRQCLK